MTLIRGTDGLDYKNLSDKLLGIPALTTRNYEVLRLQALQDHGWISKADAKEIFERRQRSGELEADYCGPDFRNGFAP